MFYIKKTVLRPINDRVLVQWVRDVKKKSSLIIEDSVEQQTFIPQEMVVIAIPNTEKILKVGDVVRPYNFLVKNGHKEEYIWRYPQYTPHFDDTVRYYFPAVPTMELQILEKGIEGETWEFEQEIDRKKKLIL